MHRFRIFAVLFLLVCTEKAMAEGPCDAALVKSTYSSFSSDHLDWRVASLVTEKEYDEIKHDAGVSAVIYGVPVGANYADFQKRIKEKESQYYESLTHDQAMNILWTGLDPNATTAYSECLRTEVLTSRGLHLAVKSATRSDISILVSWVPQGSDPGTILPEWIWRSHGGATLPTHLRQGLTTIVVRRPDQQQTLAVNYPGFTDSVVLEPIPPRVIKAPEFQSTTEVYKSESFPSGRCKQFGQWYSLCSPDKPAGWTIVSWTFQLIGDRSCGAWAGCEILSQSTTKICYRFVTQGHNEECHHKGNTGIHNSTGVLTVVWQHK